MKYLISFLVLFALSFSAQARYAEYVEKPFSVSIGTYSMVISDDDGDAEFTGFSLSFGYTISDLYALNGTFFALESNDFSDDTSTGYDLLAYIGTGLAGNTHGGLKAYIGGGVYNDKQKFDSLGSRIFNGLQLSGGLGYSWPKVSLDLVVNLRDSGDYEDFAGSDADISVVTSSLRLSYKF